MSAGNNTVSIAQIDEAMMMAGSDTERKEGILREMLIEPEDHDRFYIQDKKKSIFRRR